MCQYRRMHTLIPPAAWTSRPSPGEVTDRRDQTRRGTLARSASMATAPTPTDADIGAFLGRLVEFRTTLSEKDQALLDAMVAAASTNKDEQDDNVKPFWYGYNPPGPAGGYGYAAGGYYGGYSTGWAASPWGGAYGAR